MSDGSSDARYEMESGGWTISGRASGSAEARGSLSGFGSEILIAEWEARAKQLDETAEQFRSVTQKMLCSYLEKARAYRKCIEDLRRQMGHESKRQPTENAKVSDGGSLTHK